MRSEDGQEVVTWYTSKHGLINIAAASILLHKLQALLDGYVGAAGSGPGGGNTKYWSLYAL